MKPFLPATAWAAFMLYGLLSPEDGTPISWLDFPNSDKVIHAGIFAVFAGLLVAAFSGKHWRWLLITGLTASFIWGVATEAMQAIFTTYRTADWKDVVADVSGGLLGVGAFLGLRNYAWYKRFIQPIF